jgi:sulfide:quinone oxidoreductase
VKVVIAGAGVAGLEAALALQRLAADRVDLELIAAEPVFTYRPAAVAEPFGLAERREFDVREIADRCNAHLRYGRLVEADDRTGIGHVDNGDQVEFDVLLVATGARARAALPGAFTFRGPPDVAAYRELLSDVLSGVVEALVFAVPHGIVWSLPLYELALLTATYAAERERRLRITLVTPEERVMDVFGPAASAATRTLLDEHGIAARTSTFPIGFAGRRLSLAPNGALDADRCVALPVLQGDTLKGLKQTSGGFLETDEHGLVAGSRRIFAAGDVTRYPAKQGGLAALQADAAAEAIAALAGAPITPTPFRPVLRSVLMTGNGPRYLSLAGRGRADREARSTVTRQPFWSPPVKLAAPLLAPYLAGRLAPQA